jgi:Fe-S-cluster-containing hydrogenase component 2
MPLVREGYITTGELKALGKYPPEERFAKGPVAVIECIQEIPCNPCQDACPHKAIRVGPPITALPEIDSERCIGCGLCVTKCPGLAIFIVNKTYSAINATVAFPYEYFPLPAIGDMVTAVNRKGEEVGLARVTKVTNLPDFNKTPVVEIAVQKELADEVRSIKRIR